MTEPMSREEILNRLLTGAAYIEREDTPPAKKAQARARYDELEAELKRIDALEKTFQPPIPDKVKEQADKIREILKPSTASALKR